MSKETEIAILKALDSEFDIESELYQHFEAFGRWSSAEISVEAIRIANDLLGEDIEETTPLDSLIHMSVEAGQNAGYAVVAAALGLDVEILKLVIADWEENQDFAPQAVSFSEFMEKMREKREQHAKLIKEGTLARAFVAKVTKFGPKKE